MKPPLDRRNAVAPFPALVLLDVFLFANQHISLLVLGFFALSGVCAALVCAFLPVPFVLEADQVRGMPTLPFAVLVPDPRGPVLLLKLFRWACVGDGSNVSDVGISRPLIVSTRVVSTAQVPGFDPKNIVESRQYFDEHAFDYGERPSTSLWSP